MLGLSIKDITEPIGNKLKTVRKNQAYLRQNSVALAISSLRMETKWEKEKDDKVKAFRDELEGQFPEYYIDSLSLLSRFIKKHYRRDRRHSD